MTRSIWKGPYIDPSLIKFMQRKDFLEKESPKFKKIWSRRSCILPQFVGFFAQIYNGKKWISLKITEDMVGHKFGEFASTRTVGFEKKQKSSPRKA
jgi:small subunit ribosomal protein S19